MPTQTKTYSKIIDSCKIFVVKINGIKKPTDNTTRVMLDCVWYDTPILIEFSVTKLEAIVNCTSVTKWIRIPSCEANSSSGSEIRRFI